MNAPSLSIVSPVYRAENIIPELVEQIELNARKITDDFEIILVEDGSKDNSWAEIEKACAQSDKVIGVQLSRNFGQHYAITAGLDHSSKELVIVMDCDLQDRPDEFVALYEELCKGYDYVVASRSDRTDNFFKKLFSRYFYKALTFLSGTEHNHTVANFGIYKRNVIDAVGEMRESIRYFPTMVRWVGFKGGIVEVAHGERFEGKTTYNFKKLLKLAFDIILAYSDKPLNIVTRLGFIISGSSLVLSLYFLVKYFLGQIEVMGFTSLIISIWFLSGIIITTIGVVGKYVGKSFEVSRNRPLYIVKNKRNA